MEPMVLDPAVGTLMLASVALLFLSAAAHKLRNFERFDEIFSAYGLMPAALVAVNSRPRISLLVPVLEIMVAAGLAVNVYRPYAAALGIALLSGYAAAIAVNLARGHRDLACGCGGPDERRPIAAWMVWRNLFVAAAAAAAAIMPWADRNLSMTDGVTIAFGLATVALIYLCADQLLGNAQRSAQLRGSR
jgi:uncharacterized membrane protein YphA (DoxX/SURF4 family)